MKKFTFENQKLMIDYITFKVPDSDYNEKSFAKFFFDLGFNSYRKSAKFKTSIPQSILRKDENVFQVFFEIEHLHWSGTLVALSGLNAAHFYSLIQKQSIDWNILKDSKLSRLDVCFSQKLKPSKQTLLDFFHICQEQLKVTNNCEINANGKILKIGSRRSEKYGRIYEKENFLRFEHEMKQDYIEQYSTLLMKNDLLEFESQITKNFIRYFGKKLPLDSPYTTWLVTKLRPFRLASQSSLTLKTDYIHSMKIQNFQDEKALALFLQFLIYIRDLDYKQEFLGSTSYRCVHFEVRDFLEFENPSANYSTYRFQRLKNFIESLQKDFLIQKFSDKYFQSLVSIPQVQFVIVNKSIVAKVWVAEDLFHYTYPFQFPNVLNGKLAKHQFSVVSNLITTFSSPNIEKEFHIKQFIESYSKLSDQDSKKIKQHYINYIQLLITHDLIEDKIFVIRDNINYPVSRLTTFNISDGFRIYEKLNF